MSGSWTKSWTFQLVKDIEDPALLVCRATHSIPRYTNMKDEVGPSSVR